MGKITTKELIGDIIDLEQELIITEDEEEIQEITNRLAIYTKSLSDKVENLDGFIVELSRREKSLDGEIEAMSNEVKRLRNRKKAIANFKSYMNNTLLPMVVKSMGNDNVYETKSSRYKLYETYGPVEVNMQECDDAFIKTEILKKPDKVLARKEAVKADKEGYELDGITIEKVERVRRS